MENMSPEERLLAVVAAVRDEKLSRKEVAEKFGLAYGDARAIIAFAFGKHEARQAKRNATILDALRSGVSRREAAVRFGLSYSMISRIVRESGEIIPGACPRKVSRNEIIAAAKTLPNLQAVADRFGVSRERVRKIVARHERETDEHIPRGGRDYAKHPLQRVEWTCAGCGERRSRRPSQITSDLCRVCAMRDKTGRLSTAIIEDAIRRRLLGERWRPMARALGYSAQAAFGLERAAFMHLQRQGRTEDIAALWPKGIPHWLRRYDKSAPVEQQEAV